MKLRYLYPGVLIASLQIGLTGWASAEDVTPYDDDTSWHSEAAASDPDSDQPTGDDMESDGVTLSLDISSSWSRQHLDIGKGSRSTVTLSPSLSWGDGWSLRLSGDWQQIDDVYVVPAAPELAVRLCDLAAQYPLRVQRLLASGRITQEQLAVCNDLDGGRRDERRQGRGDTFLSLSRFVALTETWWLAPGLSWKEDTGDAYAGLGSGTRDAILALDLGRYGEAWGVWGSISRTLIVSHDLPTPPRNSDALTLALDWPTSEHTGMTARLDAAESSLETDPTQLSATLQGQWQPEGIWSVAGWLTRYRPENGFPEWEYGLSLAASL